jgi:hypothetical protein
MQNWPLKIFKLIFYIFENCKLIFIFEILNLIQIFSIKVDKNIGNETEKNITEKNSYNKPTRNFCVQNLVRYNP